MCPDTTLLIGFYNESKCNEFIRKIGGIQSLAGHGLVKELDLFECEQGRQQVFADGKMV